MRLQCAKKKVFGVARLNVNGEALSVDVDALRPGNGLKVNSVRETDESTGR